jgi:hypothetical protein
VCGYLQDDVGRALDDREGGAVRSTQRGLSALTRRVEGRKVDLRVMAKVVRGEGEGGAEAEGDGDGDGDGERNGER